MMLERKTKKGNLSEHNFSSRNSRKKKSNHPIKQSGSQLIDSSWDEVTCVLAVLNNHWRKWKVQNQTASYKTSSNFLTTHYAGKQQRLRHWLSTPLLCKMSTEQLVAIRCRRDLTRMWRLRWHSLLLHVDDWVKRHEQKFQLLPDNHKFHIFHTYQSCWLNHVHCNSVKSIHLIHPLQPLAELKITRLQFLPKVDSKPWNAVPPTPHFWYANSSFSNMYGIFPPA